MADNVTIGGRVFAAVEKTIAGQTVLVPRDLIGYFDADGIYHDVDALHPLPVALDATTLAALETIQANTGLDLTPLATGAKQDIAKTVLDQIAAALAGTLATAPATAGDVATTLTDNRKTVTTPGTAVALGGSAACKWVLVTALKTNTDQVNVGGSGVLAAAGSQTGSPLAAGESVSIPVSNVNKVFVDARVAGEGVSFTAGA